MKKRRKPAPNNTPLDQRIAWQRQRELRRARAELHLLAETWPADVAVMLLNDALRAALDRLDGTPSVL